VASTPADIEAAEARLRDRRWFDREGDRRTETLPALCIQANLVTQADYAEFVAATGHRAPDISAADYQTQGFLVHPYEEVEPYRWRQNQPPADKTDHPVVLVSYDDALAYAAWKGQQDGVTYRLPTALEWEKAARGAEGDYFPWGNDWQPDATHWGQSRPFGTAAIATYPLSRSVYGVEDMAGNVFEYTATLRDTNRGRSSVMKGCSWDDLPGFCRAAYEHTRPVDSRHILFGFRLVVHTDRRFAGRQTQVDEAIDSLYQIANGNPKHTIITGDRGIGKSSLLLQTRLVAQGNNRLPKRLGVDIGCDAYDGSPGITLIAKATKP
jgi:formylglycine-generating enzyme required for sulfatase activity